MSKTFNPNFNLNCNEYTLISVMERVSITYIVIIVETVGKGKVYDHYFIVCLKQRFEGS